MDQPPSARVWSEFLTLLAQLPPTTRVVFLLHAVFDASDTEVERLTGVQKDACEQHLEEARRVVRAFVRAETDPEGQPSQGKNT
jgi:DNA-directed RNA polymerase specialized sigma24 family protein